MAILETVETQPGQRRRLRLRSPIDRTPIGEIEVADADDIRLALERARKAQTDWAALPFESRARVMRRAMSILVERQDAFVDVIVRESGKPRTEAIAMGVLAGCDALSFYSRRARAVLRPRREKLHGLMRLTKKLRIVHRPRGVIGVISPWNAPFILSLNPVVQALMGGNAVLLKPSEITPYSGKLVGELFEAAGLPPDLLAVLMGDGETGALLVESGVDMISFTGSVATGRKVAEACGRRLIPCALELGGKDPMIVCADADVDRAAGGAVAGAFMNAGQYCCGTERVYVVDEIADEFIEKVVARTAELRQGSTGQFDVGSMFWEPQLEKVEAHVADAVARGARVLAGGQRNPNLGGLYYEPTVLVDVTHEMQLMREETFGPVLPIMRVRDEEEALHFANDSDYGLGGNVWTRDSTKGAELAARIDTGSVCVNDMSMTYATQEAPFGGVKQSGIGQTNGEAGLRAFCHTQPILIDRFGGRQSASLYPYSAKGEQGLQRMIRWLWGSPIGRWLSR